MKVTEIFYSIQGEGSTIGRPSVFVRLQGCNLRCTFCDSKYTWEEGKTTFVKEVAEEIRKYDCRNVVFTGGEPMLQEDEILKVLNELDEFGYTFEIETNGTIKPFYNYGRVQFNVSPKMQNSGNKKELREKDDVIKYFTKLEKVIFKFVVEDEHDLMEILSFQMKYNIPDKKIYLMPEGIDKEILLEREKWLIEICKKHSFNYTPRLHIMIWGNIRKV